MYACAQTIVPTPPALKLHYYLITKSDNMHMLSTIEFLINEDIPQQLQRSAILSQRFINQIMSRSGPNQHSINREYLASVRNAANEDELRMVVRDCQYSIVRMLDRLIEWIPGPEVERIDMLDPDDEGKYVFKHLHQVLYGLYMHIEKDYNRYMDHRYRIPAYSRLLFEASVIDTLVALKSSPHFRSLNSRLQYIVTEPLELIVSAPYDEGLSYHSRNYIEALADQLLNFVKKGDDDVWSLYNRLQFIDFNNISYVLYLREKFSEECLPTLSHKEKYVWLLERRKKIAHQLVEDGTSFMPGQKSLKAMLNEWLKWEISHVKRMMELELITK